jgi:hypothetical protein
MVFFFGKSSKILEIYNEHFFKCEKCNSPEFVYIVHQCYFHIFWIPVFPIFKFVGIYCHNCHDSISEVFSETARMFAKQTKTPFYMYSWPIIILIIIIIKITKFLI